jgi:hypothetical protein
LDEVLLRLNFSGFLVDFNEDDRESHATRQPFKATGYPFLTFSGAVFEELGGQTLCSLMLRAL